MHFLKEARNCKVAGRGKCISNVPAAVMEEIQRRISGRGLEKILRNFKGGEISYSKEYTRMVKRNVSVVLFLDGKVGETEFFVWDKETGATVVVYREIYPNQTDPFFSMMLATTSSECSMNGKEEKEGMLRQGC